MSEQENTTPTEEKPARRKRSANGDSALDQLGPHVHMAMCAIKKVLSEHGGITKDRDAPPAAGGYRFRGIDDMYNVLCGLTAEHKLVLYPRVVGTPRIEYQTTDKGKMQTHVHLIMEIDFVSALDGTMHTTCTIGEALDTSDKASNKAMSAAMKYAQIMAFQIPTEGEDDTERENIPVAPAVQKAIARAQPAPAPTPAKPGPAKTKPEPQIANGNGFPDEPAVTDPADDASETLATIQGARTFKLLHDIGQEVDGWAEPGRGLLIAAVIERVAVLLGDATSMVTLEEAKPLIVALGQPKKLMSKYSEIYARLKQPKQQAVQP